MTDIDLSGLEFVALPPDPEDEFRPPPYGVAGRLMFRIPEWGVDPYAGRGRRSYTDLGILSYDGDTSVFWLMENGFAGDFIQEQVELDQPGVYVLEGVVGYYYRGDGWMTDDDETWEFASCRYATAEEAAGECFY